MNIFIVGSGISGISAAKVAIEERHTVTLLESTSEPGGLMARIANCRVGFKTFFDEIRDKKRLTLINDAKIVKVDKKANQYEVTLNNGQVVTADRVIIATGLMPYDPVEYKGKRVLTSLEYDAIIDQRQGELPPDFNKIGFSLCVGSRSKDYPLCSSVCCSYTLREIKWTLKRARPEISVFYNDLRFFGQEFYIERVFREAGVRFVRANSRYFDEDEAGVTIRYYAGGQLKEERFNYIVLAIGLRPNPELKELGKVFGFSLNEYGFIKEVAPLQTDGEEIYASGGALEPMNIKDSILTGFGAGLLASRGKEGVEGIKGQMQVYMEDEPLFDIEDEAGSYIFYIGTEDTFSNMLYEYVSERFIRSALTLADKGKRVYVVTKNLVMPSYSELAYEKARRAGVIFIHLEEGEGLTIEKEGAVVSGNSRVLNLKAERVLLMDDIALPIKDREFLSFYRSEPQLRWSPTRWNRGRYHAGFIRHPREKRWHEREVIAAIAEQIIDKAEERVIPQVTEERCSGCASCKNACPHDAIEIGHELMDLAIFGILSSTTAPKAKVNQEICMGCGLCASTCPSDAITHPTTDAG